MNKICVYTCITGDYDKVNELSFKEKGIDYYLFTNNKSIKSNTWEVIYIENGKLDNIRLARKMKVLGNDITNKYEITIWIDGASYIKKSVKEFIKKYCNFNEYSLVGFKHQIRNCIYDEAKACVYYGREKKEIVQKQIEYLKKNKYPKNNGLIESTIILRKNNSKKLMETMNDWFKMIENYSYRDQLSFNYCAYKNNLNYILLNESAFENDFFGRREHNANPKIDDFHVYFGEKNNYNDYNLDLQFSEKYNLLDNNYVIDVIAPVDGNEINIELNNNGGLKVKKLTIDDLKKYDIIYIENYIFDNCNCFIGNNSKIKLNYSYHAGQHIVIRIDMKIIEINEYKKIIDNLCLEKNKMIDTIENYKTLLEENNNTYSEVVEFLKKENNNLKKENNMIINSNSFKLTKPLRKIKNIFRKRG